VQSDEGEKLIIIPVSYSILGHHFIEFKVSSPEQGEHEPGDVFAVETQLLLLGCHISSLLILIPVCNPIISSPKPYALPIPNQAILIYYVHDRFHDCAVKSPSQVSGAMKSHPPAAYSDGLNTTLSW